MPPNLDRITELRVRGMRCIDDLTLDLRGLRMLIGENGTGKSTILEAIAMLAAIPSSPDFAVDVVRRVHGGRRALLRSGADGLSIGVTIEGCGAPIRYDLSVAFSGDAAYVRSENVDVLERDPPLRALRREQGVATVFDVATRGLRRIDFDSPAAAVASFGVDAQPSFRRVLDALKRIRIHLPFDVQPAWAARRRGADSPLRGGFQRDVARHLGLGGADLGNCIGALRDHPLMPGGPWERFLDDVRLGLGYELVDLSVPTTGPRGAADILFHFSGVADPVPAAAMSDGQLSYVAHAAVAATDSDASLVAVDELEAHLHPGTVVRVVGMYEQLAATAPVLVATQSDVAMDAVADQVESLRLCVLGVGMASSVLKPDPAILEAWRHQYRGIGAMRQEGLEGLVFPGGDA